MYGQSDLDSMRELGQPEHFGGSQMQTPVGEGFRIRVVGRGEVAFFQLEKSAMLLQALVGRGVIFASSNRRWGNNKKITGRERDLVVEVMTRSMEKMGVSEVRDVKE